MSKPTVNNPLVRSARLSTVAAHDLKVNPAAQREFRPEHAARILAEWDDEKFQLPYVNRRTDGSMYVMEGQHTVWAYREHFGPENPNLQIQVWLYDGLTEEREAEFFLALNNKKAPDAMAKFRVGVTAGLPDVTDIDRIVRANGCVVTNNNTTHGAIQAVGTVTRIYRKHGGENLGATIRVIRDAFGDGGFEQANLGSVSAVLARYGCAEAELATALLGIRGGSKGLAQRAFLVRDQFGCSVTDATCYVIVETFNKGRRANKRLVSWFRDEAAAA